MVTDPKRFLPQLSAQFDVVFDRIEVNLPLPSPLQERNNGTMSVVKRVRITVTPIILVDDVSTGIPFYSIREGLSKKILYPLLLLAWNLITRLGLLHASTGCHQDDRIPPLSQ